MKRFILPAMTAIKVYLETPIPAASTVLFRIGFGVLMALTLIRFMLKGWLKLYYVDPSYFFTYAGFEWVKPWPLWGLYVHVLSLIVIALLLAWGWQQCWMAFFVAIGFTWLELLDKSPYLNHYYAMSLLAFWLALLPLDRSQTSFRGYIPRWALWVLRFQVGVIYFFAGLAKINTDWLFRAEPLQRWLNAWSMLPIIGDLLDWPLTAYVMSWCGMLFDLSIPFLLLWARSRLWAYVAVVVFHLVTACLFPIGVFPWLMMGLALIFFPPDWPLQLLKITPHPETHHLSSRFIMGWRLPLIMVLVLSQILLPLRHHLYPGDPRWTNEGFRLSWMVMLIEKTALVSYRLQLKNGQEIRINPRWLLTPFQGRMLPSQPDMIVQFGQELARRWKEKGYQVEGIYADAWASVNGSLSQRLIDPQCNLLGISLSWGRTPCLALTLFE